MKLLNLNETELETMSYDDVAYLILEKKHTKMKIQELFKLVLNEMNLEEGLFEAHIADFFELLSTDKRFIMLEKGFWDLKINHPVKLVIDDDEDDIVVSEVDDEEEIEEDEINFDEEIIDDDDGDDDLKDLVIVDDEEENEVI